MIQSLHTISPIINIASNVLDIATLGFLLMILNDLKNNVKLVMNHRTASSKISHRISPLNMTNACLKLNKLNEKQALLK